MIKFSAQFVRDVRELYGTMLPNRVIEALEEGDHPLLRTFLRSAKTENDVKPEMARFIPAGMLEIMHPKHGLATALLVRLDLELEQRGRKPELVH